MEIEPELKAMNDVYAALKALDDEAKTRVLDWVAGKFSLKHPTERGDKPQEVKGAASSAGDVKLTSFESVADVFSKADPKTDPEKVLIVASYLQEAKAGGELTGREINKELKHLGHGVKNITVAIGSLINRKPKLMIQTRKEGKSQQAQKKYKVTHAGHLTATKMIAPNGTAER